MATSLELAITAIRSGRREEGRQLLNLIIQENPNTEQAWLWMSSVVDNDEQRARCLYHVLAINPNNELARKGLNVLGIVVSDSRPVKVPRDSQPIKIPKPSEKSQTGPLKSLPEPRSALARASERQTERRPFRVDPQTIAEELPFTPVKPPISKPVPVQQQAAPITGGLPHQSEPVQPIGAGQPPLTSHTAPMQSSSNQEPGHPYPQHFTAGQAHETRPTPPMPGVSMQPPAAMPHQAQFQAAGPMPSPPSNVTMGMPPQNYAVPQQMPGAPSIHSQATMGLPAYAHPSQPVPVIHSNTTMGMPLPTYLQPQAAMAMPNNAPMSFAPPPMKSSKFDEEDDEGINILAVIIFGSLSVTALGGLGMLILLLFTTGY